MDEASSGTGRWTVAFAVVIGLLSANRIAAGETIPWTSIAVVTLGTFTLVGPAAWIARDRLPESRRERLGLVAAGAVLLGLPVAIGLVLVFEIPVVVSFDAAVVGIVAGTLLAWIGEWTIVPERMRGPYA